MTELERLWSAAIFTLSQAFFSMLLSLAIGLPAAFLTAKRQFPFRKVLLSFSAVPFCIPPLLIALGFVLFYGRHGVLNQSLMGIFSLTEPPFTFLYSFWGIVLTHGLYNFPIVMRMCSDVWQKVPPDEADAARIMGARDFRVFRTVTVFQIAPAVGASAILVFLYCFFSFVIVLLFGSIGGTTLEVAVYHASRGSLNLTRAGLFALTETFLALAVTALYILLEKRTAPNTGIVSCSIPAQKAFLTLGGKTLTALFLFAVICLFCIPLALIVLQAVSSNFFVTLFARLSFWHAVFNTLCVAFATAFCATVCGSLYAFAVRLSDPERKKPFLRVLPMFPMAVSSIVAGFVFMLVFRTGSPAVLVACQSLLIFPLAYRQAAANADRIPQNLLESAQVLSVKRSQVFLRVFLPLCKPGIISAFSFSFAVSAGDASLPLMLAIPEFDTLALYVYRLASAYRFSQACAAGTVLAFLTGGVFYAGIKYGSA